MKNGPRDTNPSLVRSLDKALRVLGLLAQEHEDIDLGSLASQAKLPKSTLVRLLSTMRAHGIIQQNPKTRRYRLGWALVRLGQAAERQFDLPLILHPFLEQLARATGETASLAVRTGEYAFYVDQVLSQNIIRGAPPTGAALDLHCTAVGKMLLSELEESEVEQLIHECGLPQRTEKTITNTSRLRKELATARSRGYAIDNEEAERGGRCIAAPTHDGNGAILAAISITAPASRLTLDRIAEYAEIVCSIAEQASRALCSGRTERKE
jgi:DNA-binding IclR family transcriptional regulator